MRDMNPLMFRPMLYLRAHKVKEKQAFGPLQLQRAPGWYTFFFTLDNHLLYEYKFNI